jgi:alpha-aminoadipic semialdehyde synthase
LPIIYKVVDPIPNEQNGVLFLAQIFNPYILGNIAPQLEKLEKRLSFTPGERDVTIMRHTIGIEWPGGKQETRDINLVVYGDPNGYTAMAKCVGYPLGIAAKMLLEGEIQRKGIVMPMTTEIYSPMLKRLQSEGICAVESSVQG